MKSIATLSAAAVAATLAYGIGTSAGAPPAAPGTLHFLLREKGFPLDEGKSGPSDHERVLYRGTLLDPKSKKTVGTELGVCIVADAANQHRLVCQFVFTPSATRALSFADQITMQTIFDDAESSKPQLSAITGGTGRYNGVSGQILAKPAPNGLVDVVFQLRR